MRVYGVLITIGVLITWTWSRIDLPISWLLLTEACIGFSEELAFRGVLLAPFKKTLFRDIWIPCIFSASAFGLLHLQNLSQHLATSAVLQQTLTATFIGLLFAAVRIYMGSLWPSVMAHGLLNTWSYHQGATGAQFVSLPEASWVDVILKGMCAIPISFFLIATRNENKLRLEAFFVWCSKKADMFKKGR